MTMQLKINTTTEPHAYCANTLWEFQKQLKPKEIRPNGDEFEN